MSLQLYSNYLDIIESHYSVDGLVKIWYDSFFLPVAVKSHLQERIMNHIANLAKHYGITNNTFREFVEQYDELIYSKKCGKLPNFGLAYFSELGDWRNVKIAIRKGAKDWNWGMHSAACGGHADLIKFFIRKGADNWNFAIYGAVKGNHMELIEFIKKEKWEASNKTTI